MKRPPIIVVVGSVDHGKTTLLDHIRKTNVAAREAGAITQSIGAYEITHIPSKSVSSPRESVITFIDTPGHEAFVRMRERGAHLADLAILVVGADDGVQPQTRESIRILKETKTPFIVAINKIDRVGPKEIEKVKDELADAGVLLEGKGGNVSFHEISAKTGEGVADLLELLALAAEVEHLEYDPSAPGRGVILEAARDARRGIAATAVIQNGTLKKGDAIHAGSAHGKIKILENFLGNPVETLSASSPAIIVGFESLPSVGDELIAGNSASSLPAEQAGPRESASSLRKSASAPADAYKIILKADVAGSLEALSEVVKNLGVPIAIVDQSVGDVTDGDVRLASATGATIIAFKNRVTKPAETLAHGQNVRIVSSAVIYELIKTIEEMTAGKTAAAGALEVRATFGKKDGRQIIGGAVTEGIIKNQSVLSIERGGDEMGEARVINLQKNKRDAPLAEAPSECGLLVESKVEIKVGDILVASE